MGCFAWGCKGVYILFAIALILILIYGRYLASKGPYTPTRDPLNRTIFELPGIGPISIWPISHLFLFFIIGFAFPHCALPAMLGGIAWEGIECGIYHYQKYRSKNTPKTNITGENTQYGENWWNWSVFDLIMNAIGFYLGRWLRLSIAPTPNVNNCPDLSLSCK